MKIAIGINGSGKYLEYTSHLYAEYNTLYDDIEFDFYLATWEDEVDYSKYEWITDYVRLKEEDSIHYDIPNTPYEGHQPHYMFTSYNLNKLIKKNNIKYDAVLQTRSDIILHRATLDKLVSKLKDGDVTERLMWNSTGIDTFHQKFPGQKNRAFLWMNDEFLFGHPSSLETFSTAWDSFFIDSSSYFFKNRDNYMIGGHVWTIEFLIKNGISTSGINAHPKILIREPFRFETDDSSGGWPLKHPSPIQLEKLLKEKGALWIINNDEESRKIFETTYKGCTESKIIRGISKVSDASRNTEEKKRRNIYKK